jgi:hypothetical protein
MKNLAEYLPFIIPLAIVELTLAITALIHVLRHPKYRFGSKPVWILVVLVVEIIGPVVYFVFGRGENNEHS